MLNLGEAAELVGVSRAGFSTRAKEWIEAGLLHPVKLHDDGRTYYPEWEVRALRPRFRAAKDAPTPEQRIGQLLSYLGRYVSGRPEPEPVEAGLAG